MPNVNTARLQRKGSLRSLLRLFVLMVFTLQSFLVQTHIHVLPQSWHDGGMSTVAPKAPQAPIDADKCFLCQEYLHGGVYLTPAALAPLPPMAVVSLLPFLIAPLQLARAVSHNWRGRAPPPAA